MSIFISVPVFNRVRIAHHCIPTLRDSMATQDHLAIYDDGSIEDASILAAFADSFHRAKNIGVNAQRRNHIIDFVTSGNDYLYFTDADTIHSPMWRARLLELHQRTGYLTCGYHTQTHEAYTNNVFARRGDYLLSRFAPGVSMLLSRKQAELVVANMPAAMDFDWSIPAMLGYKCAVTEQSVVDHISHDGMHHDGSPGYDGGDRALNPTEWLVAKRREIVASLTNDLHP